jgi:hypothetical protein
VWANSPNSVGGFSRTRWANSAELGGRIPPNYAAAAKIIARLHARAKPAEEARRPMRPVREQDAELATQCVGTILCELGWAEWP